MGAALVKRRGGIARAKAARSNGQRLQRLRNAPCRPQHGQQHDDIEHDRLPDQRSDQRAVRAGERQALHQPATTRAALHRQHQFGADAAQSCRLTRAHKAQSGVVGGYGFGRRCDGARPNAKLGQLTTQRRFHIAAPGGGVADGIIGLQLHAPAKDDRLAKAPRGDPVLGIGNPRGGGANNRLQSCLATRLKDDGKIDRLRCEQCQRDEHRQLPRKAARPNPQRRSHRVTTGSHGRVTGGSLRQQAYSHRPTRS